VDLTYTTCNGARVSSATAAAYSIARRECSEKSIGQSTDRKPAHFLAAIIDVASSEMSAASQSTS